MAAELSSVGVAPRDHVVQFYGREEELTARVGAYLVEAVQSNSAAIVVATGAHRLAFRAWMAAHGTDVAAAEDAGLLYMLDAQETLDRFLVSGRPDSCRFEAVIGGRIRRAGASDRRVYIYGEMVALLWEAGHVNEAIALETRWNELGRQLSFSLFCAYPADLVLGEGDAGPRHAVCCLHSEVVGAALPVAGAASADVELIEAFPWTPHSPQAARHFVVEALRHHGAEEGLVNDAALIVTELATNAWLHARSASTVRISVSRVAVWISVADAASTLPVPQAPLPLQSSGRGLGLISAVARQWGAHPAGDGKVVWAELRR